MADKNKTFITLANLASYNEKIQKIEKVTVEEILPKSGDVDYDSVLKKYKIYQGTSLVNDANGNAPTDPDYVPTYDQSKVIGTIDLAKDLVVTSGKVVKIAEVLISDDEGRTPDDEGYIKTVDSDKLTIDGIEFQKSNVSDDSNFEFGYPIIPGTYIELTIANQKNPIFINVVDLVNDFTVKADEKEIQLAISDKRVLSASLVDLGITKEKLSQELQDALDSTNGSFVYKGTIAKVVDLPLTTAALGHAYSVLEDGQVYICTVGAIAEDTEKGILPSNATFVNIAVDTNAIGDVTKTVYVNNDDSTEISAEAYQVLVDAYNEDQKELVPTVPDPSTLYTSKKVFQTVKDYVDSAIANNIVVATEEDIENIFN